MLIIGNKCGQLCNRLFLFSHFIANAIEHDYPLINPNFGEYSKYFSATNDNNFGKYKIEIRYKHFNDTFEKLGRFLIPTVGRLLKSSPFHSIEFIGTKFDSKNKSFDLNDEKFLSKVRSKKLVITYGWLFRDFKNFSKHSDTIRNFFKPIDLHQKKVELLIRKSRQCSDILVGVHLRKGDYRQFQGGRYYFHDEVYYDKMLQINNLFQKKGKTVSFLLCSNDPISKEKFGEFSINLGPGHPVEDLYSLAKCDYIIGPPSTYSMWASFYGMVPLLQIIDQNQKIVLKAFNVNCG